MKRSWFKALWTVLLVLLLVCTAVAEEKVIFRTLSGWDMPPAYNGNPFAPGGVGGAGDLSLIHI